MHVEHGSDRGLSAPLPQLPRCCCGIHSRRAVFAAPHATVIRVLPCGYARDLIRGQLHRCEAPSVRLPAVLPQDEIQIVVSGLFPLLWQVFCVCGSHVQEESRLPVLRCALRLDIYQPVVIEIDIEHRANRGLDAPLPQLSRRRGGIRGRRAVSSLPCVPIRIPLAGPYPAERAARRRNHGDAGAVQHDPVPIEVEVESLSPQPVALFLRVGVRARRVVHQQKKLILDVGRAAIVLHVHQVVAVEMHIELRADQRVAMRRRSAVDVHIRIDDFIVHV